MTGFFNVYKEAGFTSHDVVAIIRKLTRAKTGHTGTLDPDAEGVLPVCVGRGTKFAEFLTAQDKAYVAEVVLGVETDTGDMTGEVQQRLPVAFDEDVIIKTIKNFRGPQLQIPPMYSAVKIDGKRLYQLAREGKTVERKPRPVNIIDIRAFGFRPAENIFSIDVTCSKGTYIRSLCMDIGKALGTCAAMGSLLRTRSGKFSLDTAVKISDLRIAAEKNCLSTLLLPVEEIFPLPRAYVNHDGYLMAKNGNPIPITMVKLANGSIPAGGNFWLHGPDDDAIGLFSLKPGLDKLCLEVLL